MIVPVVVFLALFAIDLYATWWSMRRTGYEIGRSVYQ